MIIEKGRLDNDITMLYRAAMELQTPTQLIVPVDMINHIDFKALREVFDEFMDEYIRESETPAQQIKIDFETYKDFIKYINRSSENIDERNAAMVFYEKLSDPEFVERLGIQPVRGIEKIISEILTSGKNLSVERLREMYNDWISQMNNALENDLQTNANYAAIQEYLESFEPVEFRNLRYNRVAYTARLVNAETNEDLNSDQSLYLFNNCVTTSFVPFIQYNAADSRKYFKIYESNQLDYTKIIPANLLNVENTFFMIISTSRFPKDDYTFAIYDITLKKLEISTVLNELQLEETNNLIETSLQGVKVVDVQERRISGEFDILGMNKNDYDDPTFLDSILNDPVISLYLYIEESIVSYPYRKRLNIHYHSLQLSSIDTDSETKRPSSVSVMLTPQESGIKVNIVKALNRNVVDEFIRIFSLILSVYKYKRPTIRAEYSEFIPDFDKVETEGAEEAETGIVTRKCVGAAIKELNTKAKDIFVSGYAKRCPCEQQPRILTREEADQVEGQIFYFNGEPTKRQILRFPRDNPEFYFECTNPDFPFVGVKKNDLKNKGRYPYIPCCFPRDQTVEGAKTEYNEYYVTRRQVQTGQVARGTSLIKTDRILEEGRRGYLPSPIEQFLTVVFGEAGDHYVRRGVPSDKYSILHAVCIATEDREYQRDRIGRINELYRRYLDIPKEILLQELYNFDQLEMDKIIRQDFIDTKYVYRAIEEIFGINLYVFVKEDTDANSYLEIPNNAYGSIRPVNSNRKTVIVYKSKGAESEAREYPHYELITKDYITVFAKSETMHQAFYSVQNIMIMQTMGYSEITNNLLNIRTFLGSKGVENIVSQYIDKYGKLRGVVAHYKNKLIYIGTPPMQPTNAPVVESNPYRPEEVFNLQSKVKDFFEIFGEITAVTIDKQTSKRSNVKAVWFEEFFTLIDETLPNEKVSNLEVKSYPPLPNQTRINPSERLFIMRRVANILVQITYWLYTISYRNSELTVESFVERYFALRDFGDQDTSQIYFPLDLNILFFPQVRNVSEAFHWVEINFPKFCDGSKLFMYSEEFYERMRGMLDKIVNQKRRLPREGLEIPDRFIGMFQRPNDFMTPMNSYVFMSERELFAWYAAKNSNISHVMIQDKLPTKYVSSDPIVFINEDQLYWFQHAQSLDQAKSIATRWLQYRVNAGIYQQDIEDKLNDYLLYSATPTGELIFVEQVGENPEIALYVYPKEGERVTNYACILLA